MKTKIGIIIGIIMLLVMTAKAEGLLVGSSDPKDAQIIEQNTIILQLEHRADADKKAIKDADLPLINPKIDPFLASPTYGHNMFYQVLENEWGVGRIRKAMVGAFRVIDDYDFVDIPLDKCKGKQLFKQRSIFWSTGDFDYHCAKHQWTVEGKYDGKWYPLYVGKDYMDAKQWMENQ